MVLAPYKVPCGPRRTSMRSMSYGMRSSWKRLATAKLELEPSGESSM